MENELEDALGDSWKITPIGQVSSSHYFTDTQEVMRWLEDMVDIFIYSILFIAL